MNVVFQHVVRHGFISFADSSVTEIPVQVIGEHLISTGRNGYLLPFEVISVFLLACIIAALLIARKEEDKK